jgi:putative hemolysin
MNIYFELFVLLGLILVNGFLSMSEMALVSARKIRLRQQEQEGLPGAATALELKENPGRMLSTVQIGITLIGIVVGALGSASLTAVVAGWLSNIAFLAPYARIIAATIVVAVITYLSLILGELAPKRIALNSSERIARMVAPTMAFLTRITAPLERFLSASTELVLRMIGVKPQPEAPVTDEEVRILIEQGTLFGVFEPIEEEIVGKLFRLSDLSVGALLTPRTDVAWLDVKDTPQEIAAKLEEGNHSRYPVADGDLDNVIGVLLVKDLFAEMLQGRSAEPRSVMQAPLFIPDSMPALEALERLRQTRTHIALVIDEYGGLEGIVTLADFVEAIIGEVPDVGEESEPEVVRRPDGTFLLDGMMPIDRFQDIFELKELPEETEGYYQTVGGFVMSMLGRVPTAGDLFEWQHLRLEVMDMDGRRVDKVLLTLLPSGDE